MLPPVDTTTALAIGLAAGFALLNLLLLIVWLVWLRPSHDTPDANTPPDVEKRPSVLRKKRRPPRASPTVPPHAHTPPRARPEIRVVDGQIPPTNCEEPPYLSRDRYTPPPKMHPKKRAVMRARAARVLSPLFERRAASRIKQTQPGTHHKVPGAGTARARSSYTASLYSTASTPRAKDVPTGPFAGEIETPLYPFLTPNALDLAKALAPETYDKTLTRRRGYEHGLDVLATPNMPRRPPPASTPEMTRRHPTQPHFTSRFPAKPPPARRILSLGGSPLAPKRDSRMLKPLSHVP